MLLFKSSEMSDGIRRGLFLCSYSVVPALFPFMALSVFICKSKAADFFCGILRPLTSFLKIPASCGGILLSAIIGGYPSAAKCINDYVIDGIIDRKTGARMLCFSVNAGPSFLISALGTTVFGNFRVGIFLFCAQFISAAIIAFILSLFYKKQISETKPLRLPRKSNSVCAVESVISASESCFRMCAFIVLASGVLETVFDGSLFRSFSGSPVFEAVFSGFFEVTSGAFACGKIEGQTGVILAGAIASFSGISAMLQVAAITDESEIPLFPFIVSRFSHAAITAFILWIFLLFSGETAEVFSFGTEKLDAVFYSSAPAAVSLFCMASLFLLSVVPPESEKEPLLSRIKNKFNIF